MLLKASMNMISDVHLPDQLVNQHTEEVGPPGLPRQLAELSQRKSELPGVREVRGGANVVGPTGKLKEKRYTKHGRMTVEYDISCNVSPQYVCIFCSFPLFFRFLLAFSFYTSDLHG